MPDLDAVKAAFDQLNILAPQIKRQRLRRVGIETDVVDKGIVIARHMRQPVVGDRLDIFAAVLPVVHIVVKVLVPA